MLQYTKKPPNFAKKMELDKYIELFTPNQPEIAELLNELKVKREENKKLRNRIALLEEELQISKGALDMLIESECI